MGLAELLSGLRRSFTVDPKPRPPKPARNSSEAATTIPLDRPLSHEERAIAEWLLHNADPPALDYLPQLDAARVRGQCGCGCPTVDLEVPAHTAPAGQRDHSFAEATGRIGQEMVEVALFQRDGYLTGLDVTEYTGIPRPVGFPHLDSLSAFHRKESETTS